MDGGKFLASGTYGMVFKPPLPCKQKLPMDLSKLNQIGKVFKNDEEFISEQKMMELISEKFADFALPIRYVCRIDTPNPRIVKDIPSNLKDRLREGQNQIVYPNGGKELYEYVVSKNNGTRSAKILCAVRVFKYFKNIIYGLETMVKSNMLHNDIKPQNILYNEKNKQLYLIDWGLATTLNNTYDKIDAVKAHIYPYYVPEYRMSYFFYTHKRLPEIKEVVEIIKTNFRYLTDDLTKVYSVLGINPTGEILDFLEHLQTVHKLHTQQTRFFGKYAATNDAYAIGITMLQVLMELDVLKEKDVRLQFIKMFIKDLIHIDPRRRPSVGEVITNYNLTCEYL